MTDEPRPGEDAGDERRGLDVEPDALPHAVDGAAAVDGVDSHPAADLESLGSSLLWRIGRAFDDGPLTVRVGLASAAPLFADLPRLRAASDQEVEAALAEGDVQVEWVGPRLSGGRG